MSDEGFLLNEIAVRFERILPVAIDRLWTALTDGDALARWLMAPARIEPRPGGMVSLGDGHVRGVVTQWAPGRTLAFSWTVFAPGETESRYPESYVSFQLSTAGEGSRLVLTHRPMITGSEGPTRMGWHGFLDRLDQLLRSVTPDTMAVAMERHRARYGVAAAPSAGPDA